MPKKIIGLVVAGALALFGGASVPVLAAAETPQQVLPAEVRPAETKAQKAAKARAKAAQAAKARAAQAAKARTAKARAAAQARAKAVARAKAAAIAKARAAARARDHYVAMSGPRAAAAARAVVVARARAAAAARAVAPARARAVVIARSAAVARARAAALPKKTKKQAKAKKKAEQAAKKATQTAVKAAAQARAAVAAVPRARAQITARIYAANEARAIYVALAGPRAALAARHAAAAQVRAAASTRALAVPRARAAAAARAAVVARNRAIAIARTRATAKQKKAASSAAVAAARASVTATRRFRAVVAVWARSKSLARELRVAAGRARTAAGPNSGWAPTDTVIFNHPRGSKRQKYALITQLNRAIDATPAGGQIRMAMYLFDIGSVTDKLVAAHRRGVSTQVLIDDGMNNKYIRKLKSALGRNKKARSFFAVCDHSCMSQGTSTIHAKFYLFSVAGKSRYVSLVSSGNPYSGNTSKSWNNTHTIVRNKAIYNSLSKYFTDMLPDKTNLNYYRVTRSGKYTVYYYPQKIRRSQDLVWNQVLNRVSCATTAPGYGNAKRRTIIRVANWGWTQPRVDVARRVWALHNAGCAVQVMINRARTSKSVLKVLLKRSKRYGKMPVYNAWRDWRKKAVAGLYVHHKFVSINGLYGGKNVKITLTGSQNYTALGTQANNDLVLRVDDARMTDAYIRNFAFIRSRWTNRMRTVPLITRPANRVGGA